MRPVKLSTNCSAATGVSLSLLPLAGAALSIIGPGDVGLFLGAGKIADVATQVAEHCVTHPTHPAGNAAVLAEAEVSGPPVLLLRDRLEGD